MPADDNLIAQEIRQGLEQLPVSPEIKSRLETKLLPLYRFLRGQNLTEGVRKQWFDYEDRINRCFHFDARSLKTEILRPGQKKALTYDQCNTLTSCINSYGNSSNELEIGTYFSTDEYAQLAAKEPRLLFENPETIGANFAAHIIYFGRGNFVDFYQSHPSFFLQGYKDSIHRYQEIVDHYYYYSDDNHFYRRHVEESEYTKWFTLEERNTLSLSRGSIEWLDVFRSIRAAQKEPGILWQSLSITINNVRDVSNRFQHAGLTEFGYFVAADRQPRLFTQPAQETNEHIKTAVRQWVGSKATTDQRREMLRRIILHGVGCPHIFVASQEMSNYVDDWITRIAGKNANTDERIDACCSFLEFAKRYPEVLNPASKEAQNLSLLFNALRKGFLSVATKTRGNTFASLAQVLKNPRLLQMDNEDIILRMVAASTGIIKKDNRSFFSKSHKTIEKGIFESLGHEDISSEVEQIHPLEPSVEMWRKYIHVVDIIDKPLLSPPKGETPIVANSNAAIQNEEEANNLLLRTLIRSGLIEGKLQDR